LANEQSTVINSHVSALVDHENQDITFTYSLENGPCSKSYGLNVAQMAQFPKKAMESAKIKMKEVFEFVCCKNFCSSRFPFCFLRDSLEDLCILHHQKEE